MKPILLLEALCLLAFTLHGNAASTSPPPSLRLSSPLEYQVVQRTPRNDGTFRIVGSLPEPSATATTIQVRLSGTPSPAQWNDITTVPAGQTNFQGALSALAGDWYRLEVRAFRANADPSTAAETSVEHVGVGEVFVIAGQSNSANHGEEKLKVTSGRVVTFTGTEWVPSHDPQPGASGGGGSFIAPFGDGIAESFGVPVGIIAVGVGATSVREWLPRGTRFPNPPTLTGNVTQLSPTEWESKGTLFERFTQRLAALGPQGFRAVLWHQGESDANQKDTSRTLPGDLYRQHMELLIRESSQKIGWNPPWFVALVSYHTPDDPGSPDIRAAQKSLWTSGAALEGPDSDALTGDLRDGDGKGVHFSGKGLREHGARWAEKVGAWLNR